MTCETPKNTSPSTAWHIIPQEDRKINVTKAVIDIDRLLFYLPVGVTLQISEFSDFQGRGGDCHFPDFPVPDPVHHLFFPGKLFSDVGVSMGIPVLDKLYM